MAAKPNLIFSLIVATIVTIAFYFKSSSYIFNELSGWALAGVYAGIFIFAFGVSFLLNNWKNYKHIFSMNKYSIFLLLSIFMSAVATWTAGWNWLNFILGTGTAFAVFYIFWRFDYDKIKTSFVQLCKSLFYGVILPSMFLIIALMGAIDNHNTFMDKVTPAMNLAGETFTNAFIKIIQEIYDLGKYKYSIQFMIATFVFLVLFALYDFLKETKPIYYEKKGKKVEIK